MDLKLKTIIFGLVVIIVIFVAYFGLSTVQHDSTFSDAGTSYNKTTDWICSNKNVVQISENGTTINNTSPDNVAYVAHSGDYWAEIPLRVEFDVGNVVGDPYLQIVDEKNNFKGFLGSANNSHVKLQIKGDGIEWAIGNKMQAPFKHDMDKCYIRFVVPQNTSITYTNFKISPA